MGRTQRRLVSFAFLTFASLPVTAHSATPSVGASLGFSLYMPTHQNDVLSVGIPGGTGQLIPAFMPGFRFAIADDSGANSVIIEPGFSMVNFSGGTFAQFQGILSYQRV